MVLCAEAACFDGALREAAHGVVVAKGLGALMVRRLHLGCDVRVVLLREETGCSVARGFVRVRLREIANVRWAVPRVAIVAAVCRGEGRHGEIICVSRYTAVL
jgi:hypothetical protein